MAELAGLPRRPKKIERRVKELEDKPDMCGKSMRRPTGRNAWMAKGRQEPGEDNDPFGLLKLLLT